MAERKFTPEDMQLVVVSMCISQRQAGESFTEDEIGEDALGMASRLLAQLMNDPDARDVFAEQMGNLLDERDKLVASCTCEPKPSGEAPDQPAADCPIHGAAAL